MDSPGRRLPHYDVVCLKGYLIRYDRISDGILTNYSLAISLGRCPGPIVSSGPRMGRDAERKCQNDMITILYLRVWSFLLSTVHILNGSCLHGINMENPVLTNFGAGQTVAVPNLFTIYLANRPNNRSIMAAIKPNGNLSARVDGCTWNAAFSGVFGVIRGPVAVRPPYQQCHSKCPQLPLPQGVKHGESDRMVWVKGGGAVQLRVSSAKWANKCQRVVHFP